MTSLFFHPLSLIASTVDTRNISSGRTGIYCCDSVYFVECFGNSYLLKKVTKIKDLNNFSARTNIAKFIYLDFI
jgi:hypothetical protein